MADHSAQRMRALAQVVADNFASAPLSSEQKNPKQIARTDLSWACPPLRTHSKLGNTAVGEYLIPDCDVNADALYDFWVLNLKQLWEVPLSCLKGGLYVGLSKVLPGSRKGMQALAFSIPVGWPVKVDESAGLTLSLEAAHLALNCLPDLQASVDDEDNYYAVLADGRIIGVKDGRPAAGAYWQDYDQRGLITDLTETFRGEAVIECQYDQLATMRSVLWEHQKAFPQFEAMDIAMQALRVLSFGGRCPNLAPGGRELAGRIEQLREREILLREALDVMDANMNDRRKLECLYNSLVPDVISKSYFRKHIFSSLQFPYNMLPGRADTIRGELRALYEAIPCNLRRNLP